MDSTVVEVQASIPARSLIVPIMVLFSNKEKNFLRGYKVATTLCLMGLHSTPRPQGSLPDLKLCPIWIGKIIVANEVVQYWTQWELFEKQLFKKKATVIFHYEKRKYIEQQKFREFFLILSFNKSAWWWAATSHCANNQISCHLALDRNGVLSSNRCSFLREFLARKLVP